MVSDRRPIIHVGLPKTGTTWLQRHGFAAIAGLDVVAIKTAPRVIQQVLQYLDDPGRCTADEVRRRIGTSSGTPMLSSENIASPWSWTPESGLRRAHTLKRLVPDAKIVLVVREQASMISSLYAQYIKHGGYVGFRRFVDGDMPHPRFDIDWLQYHRHVDTYHVHFAASDVLVLTYEHLRADPRSFIAAVAEFAGLTYDGELRDRTRANPTPARGALACLRVVNRLVRASPLNPSPVLFPLPGADRARGIAQRFPAASAARVLGRDDAAWAAALAQRCAQSNRRLAELSGLDLRRWEYQVSDIAAGQLTDAMTVRRTDVGNRHLSGARSSATAG